MLLHRESRVVVQGITGKQGRKIAGEMTAYGTAVVAGVTPGKGGENVHGIPVYDTMDEALSRHPDMDTSLVCVPRESARPAAAEAIASGRISLVNIVTEGIPARDTAEILQLAEDAGVRVVGPASIGIIVPRYRVKIGPIGGNDPGVFYPGRIALFSKSGGMCLSISMAIFNKLGFGMSVVVGIGGDRIIGTTFKDLLEMVRDDPETALVILNGEVGGTYEEDAAEYIAAAGYPKRVIARLTGIGAEAMFPAGTRLGHAGAILGERGRGTFESKVSALEGAGVPVAQTTEELLTLVEREMPARRANLSANDAVEDELVSISKRKLEQLKTQVRAVQTRTGLTQLRDGIPYFRGYALTDLMRRARIAEMRLMAIKRQDPAPDRLAWFGRVFEACNRGLPPMEEAFRAAIAASRNGNPLNAACAAGVLALPAASPLEKAPHSLREHTSAAELEAVLLGIQTTHIVARILGHEIVWNAGVPDEDLFFRAMAGRDPSPQEAQLARAIYAACLDHTPATPSSLAALTAYSGGNSLKTALAAAITAMGSTHAGAGEEAAKIFQEYISAYNQAIQERGRYESDGVRVRSLEELAEYIVAKWTGSFGDPKRKIPGYGHRYYGQYGRDPRAVAMLEIAGQLGLAGQYVALADAIEENLRARKHPALCMNVDGAIGAVISEAGIHWRAGKAAFIIPRTLGVLGELLEQQAGSFFRLANESAVYIGPDTGRRYEVASQST